MTESESAQKKLQDEVNLATKRSQNNLSKQILEKRLSKRTKILSSSSKENRKDFTKKQRDIIQDLVRIQSFNNSNDKPSFGKFFE